MLLGARRQASHGPPAASSCLVNLKIGEFLPESLIIAGERMDVQGRGEPWEAQAANSREGTRIEWNWTEGPNGINPGMIRVDSAARLASITPVWCCSPAQRRQPLRR